MAITKLDHLKESKKGNPAAHLKNAIRYILNPEKTNGGMFVGGNCGTSAEEIYASMISTKEFFGKTGGGRKNAEAAPGPGNEGERQLRPDRLGEWLQDHRNKNLRLSVRRIPLPVQNRVLYLP